MYCAAFSADLLKAPSNVSRAHCNVCSIAWGKFFNVQIGMLFSGGSCVALYDSVTNGTTTYGKKNRNAGEWNGRWIGFERQMLTWTFPIVPKVPESMSIRR